MFLLLTLNMLMPTGKILELIISQMHTVKFPLSKASHNRPTTCNYNINKGFPDLDLPILLNIVVFTPRIITETWGTESYYGICSRFLAATIFFFFFFL